MTEKYPYFIYPDVIALRECSDPEETMRLRRRIAANVGDRSALRIIFGMDPEEFSRFYPDMSPATLSTTDTIDTFLARFGKPDAPVSRAAAEIGTAYASPEETLVEETYTLKETMPEETPPDDPTSSAIDSFLSTVTPPGEETPPSEQDARECIKNRDYQKALEIIMRLHLNNPEKSIYFADQIRFLRKLILNQAKQNNENS